MGKRSFSCDMGVRGGSHINLIESLSSLPRRVKPLSRGEVYSLIRAAEKPRDRGFIAALYLTAARVSELLMLTTRDVSFEDEYLVVRLLTLKRRDWQPYRYVPIPLADGFCRPLLRWLGECQSQRLFSFSRQYAWQLLRRLGEKALRQRVWPHLLRHSRLTELGSHLTIVELCQFAGWRLPDAFGEARTYLHLNWRSYAHKIPRPGVPGGLTPLGPEPRGGESHERCEEP